MELDVLPAGLIQTNAYLLSAPERGEALLIDAPGDVWADVGPLLTERKCRLTEVWITHGHWDHMQGGAEVVRATGAKVRAHEADRPLIETPEIMERFMGERLNLEGLKVDHWVGEGDALEALGIKIETAHHEVAPGQHEIDFEYSDALSTADNATTFKYALKEIAKQHGLYASFMPKPIFGINGSGMHTHQSLASLSTGKNVFYDANDKYSLSPIAKSYMAGVLKHARAMIAILAPTVNSYKRLVPGYEAPTYLVWGRRNRSALIRVPMISAGRSVEGTRMELRCPDPSANPYLAFAVMIAAGLDGVENNLELPDPVEESLYEMDAARVAQQGIRELPGSLDEAIDEMRADPVVTGALGDHVLSNFLEAKRAETEDYRIHVSQWELERYLDVY